MAVAVVVLVVIALCGGSERRINVCVLREIRYIWGLRRERAGKMTQTRTETLRTEVDALREENEQLREKLDERKSALN